MSEDRGPKTGLAGEGEGRQARLFTRGTGNFPVKSHPTWLIMPFFFSSKLVNAAIARTTEENEL